MNREANEIIVRPIITENSMDMLALKKYTFRVAPGVNKIEIAKAVEKQFGVKVKGINTISVSGKKRRQGNHVGYQPDWKKAIVTLTADSKGIEFFESMA